MGRRKFINYAIAVIVTGIVVGAGTYFAVPAKEVTKTITKTAAAETITKTVTITPTPVKPKKKVEIKWLFWPMFKVDPILDDLAKFEEETGIKVTPVSMAYGEIYAKIKTTCEAKSPDFDVFIVNDDWFCALIPHIEPLNDLLEYPKTKDDWASPLAYEMSTLTGMFAPLAEKLGGIYKDVSTNKLLMMAPFSMDGHHLFWRKDLFEKAGLTKPPTNRDETKEYAKKLNNPPDTYGIVWPSKGVPATHEWFNWFFAAGGELFDRELKPGWDSEPGYKALDFLYTLYAKEKVAPPGILGYHYKENREFFAAGKAAMCLDWPSSLWTFTDPKKSLIVDKFEVANFPWDEKKANHVGLWNWGILKYSKHKEEAGIFLSWLFKPEIQLKYTATGSGIPTTKKAAKLLETERPGVFGRWADVIVKGVEVGVPLMPMPEWPRICDILSEEIQACLMDKKTAKEAMDSAAKRAEELLAHYYK